MLAALAGLLCGPALLWGSARPAPLDRIEPPRERERQAWRRLWRPLAPAAVVLAFLAGWALQEPEASEGLPPPLLAPAALLALTFGLIVARAVVRATRALRLPARGVAAMTYGLLRPRVYIAPELGARLDAPALRAALEHEAAHARHRDPLRLWLAQLATDLQWPLRAARGRFADWRDALELARDAEACERVEGSDLATALIEAARLARAQRAAAAVGLVTGADAALVFTDRIQRLLDHPPPGAAAAAGTDAAAPRPAEGASARGRARRWAWPLLVTVLGLALAAGGLLGESVVRLLGHL